MTYGGRFTYISGHPSAEGRVQHRESSPFKDQHSTAVPCNQGLVCPNLEGRFPILDATRIPVSRSNGQRSGLEAVAGIPCRPNQGATLLVMIKNELLDCYVCVSKTITGQPRNSIFTCRV